MFYSCPRAYFFQDGETPLIQSFLVQKLFQASGYCFSLWLLVQMYLFLNCRDQNGKSYSMCVPPSSFPNNFGHLNFFFHGYCTLKWNTFQVLFPEWWQCMLSVTAYASSGLVFFSLVCFSFRFSVRSHVMICYPITWYFETLSCTITKDFSMDCSKYFIFHRLNQFTVELFWCVQKL